MVGMKGTATIMEKLRNMEDVRTDSLTYLAGSVPEEGEIKAEFVNKKEYDIEINLVEDRVSSLSFYLNDHLRLDNFIRKYGEPGYVLLTERNADFLRSVTAHIYYPDIGACLRLTSFPFWIGSSEQYLINGTSRVTMVWYVEPGSTSMDRFNVCKVWQHSRIVNQEWRGYGFYRGSNDVQ